MEAPLALQREQRDRRAVERLEVENFKETKEKSTETPTTKCVAVVGH